MAYTNGVDKTLLLHLKNDKTITLHPAGGIAPADLPALYDKYKKELSNKTGYIELTGVPSTSQSYDLYINVEHVVGLVVGTWGYTNDDVI